ncbi:hypothetical protein Q5P01_006441 [Channa striata]|uniref:Uncharacterized protein n=1 Tax=Channa striata TaxID=64152 RepID=A0AA88N911_CHASR|nr:hypothetical protein Q5P01_006441 [Channa striata]
MESDKQKGDDKKVKQVRMNREIVWGDSGTWRGCLGAAGERGLVEAEATDVGEACYVKLALLASFRFLLLSHWSVNI